jgi:hypothetical protein
MPYRIVEALQLLSLAPSVNAAMLDGWQPSGTPFMDSESRQWCQAMIRHENPAKPGTIQLKEVAAAGKRR